MTGASGGGFDAACGHAVWGTMAGAMVSEAPGAPPGPLDQLLDLAQPLMDRLGVGVLSESPLVAVTAADDTTLALLIRGPVSFKLTEEITIGAFVRLELLVSRRLDHSNLLMPLRILEWRSAIGEISIAEAGVFSARTGIGRYIDATTGLETWLGHGQLVLDKLEFGLDLFLGGINSRGVMFGVDIELPIAIPLGSTGLAMRGFGGDMAINFRPRLERRGEPVLHPTARDYVQWAASDAIDRWQPALLDQFAGGLAARAVLVTWPDNGRTIALDPVGVTTLVPGPVIVVGGVGILLDTVSLLVQGYFAVDVASWSLAFGLHLDLTYPAADDPQPGEDWEDTSDYDDAEHYDHKVSVVRGIGVVDSLFSFQNPELWYLNAGTMHRPLRIAVFYNLIRGDAFMMLDVHRYRFGASLTFGPDWRFSGVRLQLQITAAFDGLIGWDPFEMEALVGVEAHLEISWLGFGLRLSATAQVIGHLPDPTSLRVRLTARAQVLWLVADAGLDVTFDASDHPLPAPTLTSPLLTGAQWPLGEPDGPAGAIPADAAPVASPIALGALHPLTARQWNVPGRPGEDLPWPDAQLVIPFGQKVIDASGAVLGPGEVPRIQGGYDVAHVLDRLTIEETATGRVLPGLGAVWGGDAARLHVPADEPFAWLAPHGSAADTAAPAPTPWFDQDFGPVQRDAVGVDPEDPRSPLDDAFSRRFGQLTVTAPGGELIDDLSPAVSTFVLRALSLSLRFSVPQFVTADVSAEIPLAVDRLSLALVVPNEEHRLVLAVGTPPRTVIVDLSTVGVVRPVYETMRLVVVDLLLPEPVQGPLKIATRPEPPPDQQGPKQPPRLLVVSVRYHLAREPACAWRPRLVMAPGSYRLRVRGHSTATPTEAALPAATPIAWGSDSEFTVGLPTSLRPYIDAVGVGDNRSFAEEPGSNPTPPDLGFPAYRHYVGFIAFKVPYVHQMFGERLRACFAADGDPPPAPGALPGTELSMSLGPDPHGGSKLPRAAQDWIRRHGGAVSADDEIAFTWPTEAAGRGSLTVWAERPGAAATERFANLWTHTCQISRYHDFRDQVRLAGSVVRRARRPDGVTELEEGGFELADLSPLSSGGLDLDADATAEPAWALDSTLDPGGPPAQDGLAFARFALACGLDVGSLLAPVDHTVLDVLETSAGRPCALHLRTPEAVDWRRVQGELATWTLLYEGEGPWPTRWGALGALRFGVSILPAPDAMSAILVGVTRGAGGSGLYLPRGACRLTLRFAAAVDGLVTLRPWLAETEAPAVLSFLQPFGDDWPVT